jgi:integrase
MTQNLFHDLTAKEVDALGPGRHRVARNLYLLVGFGRGHGGRSWVMLYNSPKTGKPRAMGLGSADLIPVAKAKEIVLRHRVALLEGRDPLDERSAARPKVRLTPTFRECAELYIRAHEAGWKSPKHRRQWPNTLETYVYPIIGDLAVNEIDTGAVMQVLEAVWHAKPETANRVRGRIETVLDYCAARHWRQGDNPARWKGHIANLLPKRRALRPTVHHAAVPWRELPALWTDLVRREDIPAVALRLAILSATRTNETRGARWAEIDIDAGIWTIPAARMKGNREHRVPLTTAVCRLLDQLEPLRRDDYLFPGARAGGPIGTNAMALVLHELYADATVHGMRSAFRDWCSENGIVGEVAEMALAHKIANGVEAAYRRGDLLEPRRAAMERWARFLAAAGVLRAIA